MNKLTIIDNLKLKLKYVLSAVPVSLILGGLLGYSIGIYDKRDSIVISDKVSAVVNTYKSPLTIPQPLIKVTGLDSISQKIYFFNGNSFPITIDSITIYDHKLADNIRLKPSQQGFVKVVYKTYATVMDDVQVKFWTDGEPTICWLRNKRTK